MAQEPRPAPVLTIVDPSCPGTFVDLVQGHEPREPFRPSLVQLIAGALALLLAVSAGAVADLRGDLAEADRRLISALSAVGFDNGLADAVQAASALDATTLDYVFVLDAPDASVVEVLGVEVSGAGWRARTGVEHPTGRDALALSHDVDCDLPIQVRPVVVVTVAAGRHRRAVELDLDREFLATVQKTQRSACGDVIAAEALQVIAPRARLEGQRVRVDLVLTNTSRYDVQVTSLGVEGLKVVSLPTASPAAPIVLPGRPTGPIIRSAAARPGGPRGLPVRLEMRLLECLGVGQAHAGGAAGEGVTVLLRVDGRGGPGTLEVSVEGLTELRTDLTRARCLSGRG